MKENYTCNEDEWAALQILRSTGAEVIEAAMVAKDALRVGRGRVKRAKLCISEGEKELKKREKTVTFAKAVEAALEARKSRRARTQTDFRYMSRRFLKLCKGLDKRRMRSIEPEECAAYIRQAYHTPRQRNKARLVLSGIFSTAVKRGWCAENPVRHVEPERVEEKRISILSQEEIDRLMAAAETFDGGSCLAAVGMMLYAGIRPHEVERLRWEDVHLDAKVISISPQHSKTGGARHVTIQAPLASIITRKQGAAHQRICPANWRHRWAQLHKAANFPTWQQDVLRHTFATHHLTTHHNYAELQFEMGHRSAALLRTRYVAMEYVHGAS